MLCYILHYFRGIFHLFFSSSLKDYDCPKIGPGRAGGGGGGGVGEREFLK